VIGTSDPNPIVSGKGIQLLKERGMKTITDVLKAECTHLNRRFFTFHQKNRPYIILKWAQTKDGFIDIDRHDHGKDGIIWITDEASRQLVHKWRAEEQAILVGSRTAVMDNPRLTTRNWPGKNPLRLVIDRKGSLSGNLFILDDSVETVIFTNVPKKDRTKLKYVILDKDKDVLTVVLEFLYKNNIQSLIVEGGKILIDAFLQHETWDEARVFVGNKTFGKGVPAPLIQSEPTSQLEFSENILKIYKNRGSF
jgi:diaminohydroxyphosphoribosylaminopyrimidine deaminase/5-amino-6-(5-phosphoribosylamino)uracil reductase